MSNSRNQQKYNELAENKEHWNPEHETNKYGLVPSPNHTKGKKIVPKYEVFDLPSTKSINTWLFVTDRSLRHEGEEFKEMFSFWISLFLFFFGSYVFINAFFFQKLNNWMLGIFILLEGASDLIDGHFVQHGYKLGNHDRKNEKSCPGFKAWLFTLFYAGSVIGTICYGVFIGMKSTGRSKKLGFLKDNGENVLCMGCLFILFFPKFAASLYNVLVYTDWGMKKKLFKKKANEDRIFTKWPAMFIILMLPFWAWLCRYFSNKIMVGNSGFVFVLFFAPINYVLDVILSGHQYMLLLVRVVPFFTKKDNMAHMGTTFALKLLLWTPFWANALLGLSQFAIGFELQTSEEFPEVNFIEKASTALLMIDGSINLTQIFIGWMVYHRYWHHIRTKFQESTDNDCKVELKWLEESEFDYFGRGHDCAVSMGNCYMSFFTCCHSGEEEEEDHE